MKTTQDRIQTASWVDDARAYQPSATELNIDLRLDANEGTVDSAALKQIFSEITAEQISRYPDKSSLEATIAAKLQIQNDRIVVTNGADDALDRICRTFLGPDDEIVLPTPTFSMLAKYTAQTGARINELEWDEIEFPIEKVLSAKSERTSLVAIVSPNNPTGLVATAQQLKQVSEAFSSATILLDHAYVEFADEDLTQTALELDNVIVVRTFSKAWGLAGLRVGYAVGSPQRIDLMRRACNPYPVSGLSQAIAQRLYQDNFGSPDSQKIEQVRIEREQLSMTLQSAGFEPFPSQANFVFARFKQAKELAAFLAKDGIAIRTYSGDENAIRITCPGDAANFQRLMNSLKAYLAPPTAVNRFVE